MKNDLARNLGIKFWYIPGLTWLARYHITKIASNLVGRNIRWVSPTTPFNTYDYTASPISGVTAFNDGVFYYAHTLGAFPTFSIGTYSGTHGIFNITAVLQNTRTCLISCQITNQYTLQLWKFSDKVVWHICFRFNFSSRTSITHKICFINCKLWIKLFWIYIINHYHVHFLKTILTREMCDCMEKNVKSIPKLSL